MRRRPAFLALILVPVFLAAAGCATSHSAVRTTAFIPGQQRGVIFVADGAGGFRATSISLQQAVDAEHVPLGIEEVSWSHGYGRVLADELDYCHARAEGQLLAAKIVAFRQAFPGNAVFLVAHSAGTAVALAATESLCPDTVDRMVLLAPAVSADYDLRPALRACRCGLDVFWSRKDVVYLGLGTALLGTADREWGTAAAGRTGFRPTLAAPEDALLYSRLRQHPWDPCVSWTGNRGGHYGVYQVDYLRAYILPLLAVR